MTKNKQVVMLMSLLRLCRKKQYEDVEDVLETSLSLMGVPEAKLMAVKKEIPEKPPKKE